MKKRAYITGVLICLCICLFSAHPLYADDAAGLSDGQSIYLPVYSHIYSGNRERPYQLAVTASIRNTDPVHSIKITAIDYHATQGKLLKKYLTTPLIIEPLESLRYVIPEKDESGGSGANFIVKWESEKPVNPPIIESIMISTESQQGISFTSRGREIIETE